MQADASALYAVQCKHISSLSRSHLACSWQHVIKAQHARHQPALAQPRQPCSRSNSARAKHSTRVHWSACQHCLETDCRSQLVSM
jgi:hypothetical protein